MMEEWVGAGVDGLLLSGSEGCLGGVCWELWGGSLGRERLGSGLSLLSPEVLHGGGCSDSCMGHGRTQGASVMQAWWLADPENRALQGAVLFAGGCHGAGLGTLSTQLMEPGGPQGHSHPNAPLASTPFPTDSARF